MNLQVLLLMMGSTVKYFSSENRITGVFFFNWFRIFLQRSSLDTLMRSVSRNFWFRANDLAFRFFLTTLLTVCSDTLRSLAMPLMDLTGFLATLDLMALMSLGVDTVLGLPAPDLC